MAPLDIDRHEAVITGLVRAASRLALDWYRQPIVVDNKRAAGFDPVTAADRRVEDELRAGLGRLFPDHAILGEERGESGSGPYRWVIDPIDGTRAFICGQPMWGTLLGLQVEDRPVAGWMHQPVLDETHVATPGGGRLILGGRARPLEASKVTDLADAILLCTHPSMFAAGHEHDAFARLDRAVRMTRYSGDCVNYGLLAAGHADLVVENQLAPYDIVPLIPIVEASGGVVTDLAGRPPLGGGYVVAAATAELHAAALEVLRSA
jgi:histidinol phosphatase-like enzyme (inositol monophosphatase family)